MLTPEILYGLGALALLAALVWGVTQYKRRNRANDPVSEAATRAEYDHPGSYQTEEQKFRDQVRPS
ncbi:hypothetical protein [Phenylobacterium sp.]|uniref:hypothetical protein n=1 Tax=Phenylobacterium sp. TaxID=1871053 RepID=UPI0025FA5809|nr:hypothetical protein [Phenylobacterium sp.]